MNIPTTDLPSDYAGLVTHLINAARSMAKSEPQIEPCAFLFRKRPPVDAEPVHIDTVLLPLEFENNADKDYAASIIRTAVAAFEATAVLYFSEAYAVSQNCKAGDAEAAASIAENITPSQHPDRYEILLAIFETPDASFMATPRIHNRPEGRTIDAPIWSRPPKVAGRFMGLFGSAGAMH
jgi:hypothetical protein